MALLAFLQDVTQVLLQYGDVALFFLLAFGILALPIPDETLLITAGFLMGHKELPLVSTIICAYLGAMCGITGSYLIGRTIGVLLIRKWGYWIGFTEPRYERTKQLFNRWGPWTLSVGYFIPGVRHLTGYVAGSTKLNYFKFACFSYSGAILWVSLFLTLGYFGYFLHSEFL